MKAHILRLHKALLWSAALAAVLLPSLSDGFPLDTDTYQIRAVRVGAIDFNDPGGPANNPLAPQWASAPATPVPLDYEIKASANALAGGDAWAQVPNGRLVTVKALHDGTVLLLNAVWDDTTQSDSIADVPLFHDSLAVLIPFSGPGYEECVPGREDPPPSSEPMIHMGMRCDGLDEKGRPPGHPDFLGAKCCPVNILLWRADKVEVENIVANGMGTSLETDETDQPGVFHAFQEWGAGRWNVIMGRVLTPPPAIGEYPGDNMIPLVPGQSYPTVFGNWDGGKQERNGVKFIGLFGTLNLDP